MKLNKIQKVFLIIGVIFFLFQCYNFYDLYINWDKYRNHWMILDIYIFKTLYIVTQSIFLIFVFRNFEIWKKSVKSIIKRILSFILVDYFFLIIYRVLIIFLPSLIFSNNPLSLKYQTSFIEKINSIYFGFFNLMRPSFYITIISFYLIIITIKIIRKKY